MSCKILIRACPKPNDFFDEMIPDKGLRAGGWSLSIHRIKDIGSTHDGREAEVEIRWLYAEIECAPDDIKNSLQIHKPELVEVFEALAAHRQMQLNETLGFSYWLEEYVHDGVQGNIEPYKIDIGIRVLNFRRLDENGKVLFDAQAESQRHAHEQINNARALAKENLLENSGHIRFLNEPFYRRVFKSYGNASRHDEYIGHLYDLRDAASKRIPDAQKTLGFTNDEWSRFGLLLNNTPVTGGRHGGNHPDPLRPLTAAEKVFLFGFAQKLLLGFGRYLESEEQAQRGEGDEK